MRTSFYPTIIFFLGIFCMGLIGQGCQDASLKKNETDSLAIKNSLPPSPVLSAKESIKKMQVEEGLDIQLVASEPLVSAPVAVSFDDSGRIWAVEMQGYMPDTLGRGEEEPTGKIVILSDSNGDGTMDQRKVFLDSLILPRAICFIENGILVAEPPKLWYYQIQNDRPIKKTLVDSAYAEGGNVEHQPNGLLRAVDNWIYNAKSSKRYRKKGDKWLIEKTHFRGQWGLSQDDYGRLFYNTNSENLLGDYFSPGLGANNKNQKAVAGYSQKIVDDNGVYPARPTPGINRGYLEGMLDDSLRLVNFTAACSPLVYTADLLGQQYHNNVFVAEPSANLIKRNIVSEHGYVVSGRQAYKDREFLASKDERFRPVNLHTGPDGAIYIVDMYRGIIQHKTYLTPYLKNEIKERSLTNPLNCGRIYKIVPKARTASPVMIPADPQKLVQLLQHKNSWVRNRAQQKVIDNKLAQTIPDLQNLLNDRTQPLAAMHALWTLEGLGVLQWEQVKPLLQQRNWPLRMQALSVLPSIINAKNAKQVSSSLFRIVEEKDTLAAPYIGFILSTIRKYNVIGANQLMKALLKEYRNNKFVADALISNLQGKEKSYLQQVVKLYPDTSLAIYQRLQKVINDIAKATNNAKTKTLQKEYPKGAALYQSVCATCHGTDGNGVASLAPPLNNSEWVTGDKNKLISIVLFGLTGPVKVAGKVYKAPEINGDMPGIGQNNEFSDDDIAQLLNLVRNSWNNSGHKIKKVDIQNIRKKNTGRQRPFTATELSEMK